MREAKTETKSGILCEIYGMSDRLATSPGGGESQGEGREGREGEPGTAGHKTLP